MVYLYIRRRKHMAFVIFLILRIAIWFLAARGVESLFPGNARDREKAAIIPLACIIGVIDILANTYKG